MRHECDNAPRRRSHVRPAELCTRFPAGCRSGSMWSVWGRRACQFGFALVVALWTDSADASDTRGKRLDLSLGVHATEYPSSIEVRGRRLQLVSHSLGVSFMFDWAGFRFGGRGDFWKPAPDTVEVSGRSALLLGATLHDAFVGKLYAEAGISGGSLEFRDMPDETVEVECVETAIGFDHIFASSEDRPLVRPFLGTRVGYLHQYSPRQHGPVAVDWSGGFVQLTLGAIVRE